jgi:EAL domain-containing protein (putative c-di-GMP-specific phosphodiesterase class I)/FixJ family two-component response regulator
VGSPAQTVPRAYVLDDEPGVCAFVCDVLSRNGFLAVQFSTMPSLVERLAVEPSEILVLDLSLGQSDAVEVMQHLERLGYRGKVLLISGRDGDTLREIQHIGRSRGLSMLPPLGKPFRAAELKQRILADVETREMALGAPARSSTISLDLAEALDKDWLELWYQPKIDLKSLTICGVEALIRARHPEYGIVAPAGFLPPPNDPLYLPLSSLVIRRAMEDWARFAASGHSIKFAVNIPVSVISAPGFINLVRASLPNVPSFRGLLIEVTENEVVQDTDLFREIANQLKLYDVWLSIDDFGSAYSTLSRLLDLPFAEVKLDRVFVANCGQDALKGVVCQTVIDLAHRFGALVCAEGVENVEDVQALRDRGCDIAQGYFFAKPMPADMLLNNVLLPESPFGEQVRCIQDRGLRRPETAKT